MNIGTRIAIRLITKQQQNANESIGAKKNSLKGDEDRVTIFPKKKIVWKDFNIKLYNSAITIN